MDHPSLEERLELTQLVIALLDSWGLRDADQIPVLGLPDGTKSRMIRRFRQDTPLPQDRDVMERVDHLVGIADALRTTYPHNPAYGSLWMRRPNSRFDNRPPIIILTQNGLPGLLELRAHLDCSFDWFLDDRSRQAE